MKKHLSIIVAIMLGLTLLSGCGKSTAPISANTVNIDGKEYSMPIAVSELLNDGWTIAEDKLAVEYEPGYEIEGGSTAIKKSDTDKFFIRGVYNDSDETKTLAECKISGIQATFSVAGDLKLGLVCGVSEKSTYDEVLKAFGDPENTTTFKRGRKDEKSLAYDIQNDSKLNYNFNFAEDGAPSSFVVEVSSD